MLVIIWTRWSNPDIDSALGALQDIFNRKWVKGQFQEKQQSNNEKIDRYDFYLLLNKLHDLWILNQKLSRKIDKSIHQSSTLEKINDKLVDQIFGNSKEVSIMKLSSHRKQVKKGITHFNGNEFETNFKKEDTSNS